MPDANARRMLGWLAHDACRASFRDVALSIIGFAVIGAWAWAAGSGLLSVEITPKGTHAIGDALRIRILVSAKAELIPEVALPRERNADVSWGAPSVRSLGGPDQAGMQRWEIVIPVQVFRVGRVSLPPVEIGVGRAVLTTEPFTVETRSVRSGADAQLLRDVRPPVLLRRRAIAGWLVGLGLALVMMGVVAWWRFSRSRDAHRTHPTEPEPEIEPEEWLERRLQALERRPIADAEALRELIAAIVDVLREYIARRTGVPAPKHTTYEIAVEMRKMLPDDAAQSLQDLLASADLVKFAKYIPPADMAKTSVSRARAIASVLAARRKEEDPSAAASLR